MKLSSLILSAIVASLGSCDVLEQYQGGFCRSARLEHIEPLPEAGCFPLYSSTQSVLLIQDEDYDYQTYEDADCSTFNGNLPPIIECNSVDGYQSIFKRKKATSKKREQRDLANAQAVPEDKLSKRQGYVCPVDDARYTIRGSDNSLVARAAPPPGTTYDILNQNAQRIATGVFLGGAGGSISLAITTVQQLTQAWMNLYARNANNNYIIANLRVGRDLVTFGLLLGSGVLNNVGFDDLEEIVYDTILWVSRNPSFSCYHLNAETTVGYTAAMSFQFTPGEL